MSNNILSDAVKMLIMPASATAVNNENDEAISVAQEDGVVALAPLIAKKALELSGQQKTPNGDHYVAAHYVDGCSFGSRIQILEVCTFNPLGCLGAFLADPQGFFDLLMRY